MRVLLKSGLYLVRIFIGCIMIFLSPLLAIALPLFVVPILIAYLVWYLFGPVESPITEPRSVPIGQARPGEGVPRRNARFKNKLLTSLYDHTTNVPQMMQVSFEKFASKPALGYRKTLRNVEQKVKVKQDGQEVEKLFKIPVQTDYQWKTYAELNKEISNLHAGLSALDLKPGTNVCLFAKTRPEWQVSFQACLAGGFPVVTVYPSLGLDALVYSLGQTDITHVVTDNVEMILKVAEKVKSVRYIIYIDPVPKDKLEGYKAKYSGITLVSYDELLEKDSGKHRPSHTPKTDDIAVIMYTSGSTGNPKGVLISHGNILAAVVGIVNCIPEPICENDVYIAFLPLAHVLEMLGETCLLARGGAVGYSSPTTLRDEQVFDENEKPAGDLRKLRPTLMASVPLVLDRMKAAIEEQVNKSGPVKKLLFNTALYLKKRNKIRGVSSPILDKIFFSKIATRFGGRIRILLSGGAPLSSETQDFVSMCFCTSVIQGYGLTETMAAATVTLPGDASTGRVGPPIPCCEIKLVDVPEMGYTSADKDANGMPAPRGEVVTRGGAVTKGYYKMEEATDAAYKRDPEGEGYWFYTGDIGKWHTDGTLQIIDRKKDLVKLSHGEYIALGRLEAVYSHCSFVDNICVCANSNSTRPVALVVPNQKNLSDSAKSQGLNDYNDFKALCANKQVISHVLKQLEKSAEDCKVEKWERVAAVHLISEPWTPESGLLTEAMKLKRFEITKKFADEIKHLYKQVPQ